MRKRIRIRSLKSKIILFFIIFASIILFLQIVVFQKWIGAIIIEKSESYFQETVRQIGQRADLQFSQFRTMALGISNNQVVKNYLADVKNQSINYHIAKYKISNEIFRISKLDWIESMCIYPAGFQPPINLYYTKPVFEADSSIQTMLAEPAEAHPDEIRWAELPSVPDSMSALLSIQEAQKYGILRISISDAFFNLLQEVKLGKQGELFLVKDNVIIYAKDRTLIGTAMPAISNITSVRESYALSEPGWKLIGEVPQTEILQQIQQFNRVFILMVFIILAAVMSFAIVAARVILRPLKKIVKGMESIQQGNLDVVLEHQGNDEFSMIIFQFNRMVERVHGLIDKIVQQQRHHRESEIVSLLSKLNPHFLYNSLDMIYWKAIMKGEEELGGTIVALSDILRYSISHKNEFVTVREDMNQLECYLRIQSMRFEDKLQYAFHIQSEMMNDKIPKLVIQPLVENSIKYAFHNMMHVGKITVRGYCSKEDLVFEVADNGVGMTEEKVRAMLASFDSDNEDTGLGIRLVHERAKYLYGEGYGVSIQSTVGEGTVISVRLGKAAVHDLIK